MKTRGAELTFKHNLKRGRHGWLRLTPAYSVKLVGDLLARYPGAKTVLDPFSGTGTTGLVCAERGVACDLLDVNPFLVWLARTKTRNFVASDIELLMTSAPEIARRTLSMSHEHRWTPPITDIERWWAPARLSLLSRLFEAIREVLPTDCAARDLASLAFCRCMIDWSNAAFNHQSMSFKDRSDSLFEHEDETLVGEFSSRASMIAEAAGQYLAGSVVVREADSRQIPDPTWRPYDLVITSPPYPNRISYIRELRPYMYWLSFLREAREAGELDWRAIGGTWGIATSRMEKWQPAGSGVPFPGFDGIIDSIRSRSVVLANYVHKYFVDMIAHMRSLRPRMEDGGRVHYIVGNSKFYDTIVPVERIYAAIMREHGFTDVRVTPIRKRNSKKELIEFDVSAAAT